jgi:predicted metal-binding membrane protein
MASTQTTLARPRPQRSSASRVLLRHPELGAAVVITAAWVALLLQSCTSTRAGGAAAGMSGMGTSPAEPHDTWARAAGGLPSWMLMTAAMMGPATLGAIGYTGLNSLRWRRRRAMAEFSVASLAVWVAFGLLVLAATAVVRGIPGPGALARVLAVAAAWQLTPVKRRCLSGCHLGASLPPRGWRAEKGALRFGLRNGLYCLGTCWCLMLVMVAAPGGQLLWTAGLTGVITAERVVSRPRSTTRAVAVMLFFAAFAALAAGNLLQ